MNNQLSTPLWKEALTKKNSLSSIYEEAQGVVKDIHDPHSKLYLKEKYKFGIHNLIPIGWTLTKDEETTYGHSLESFLNHWFVHEWARKGPVSSRRDTKFPYDYKKLTFLLEDVFQIYMIDDETFIQINNKNEIRAVTGLSHKLSNYFGFLYRYEDDYGRGVDIFKKVFDIHFWDSRDVNENQQFRKNINEADGIWASYMKHRDLGGDTITKTIMNKVDYGYKFKKQVFVKARRTPEEEEFYFNLQNLLEGYSETRKLLTNQKLYDIMDLYSKFSPLKTKPQKTSKFIDLSYKMGYEVISTIKKVNRRTIRGHIIQKSVLSQLKLINEE